MNENWKCPSFRAINDSIRVSMEKNERKVNLTWMGANLTTFGFIRDVVSYFNGFILGHVSLT